MLFWDHKNMDRSLGVDIVKCEDLVILIDLLRWDLSVDYLTKQAIHNFYPFFICENYMIFDRLLSVPPMWDRLKDEKRPILLYGTGNGADKILNVMESLGIGCAGVFASDGFVRNREFRGMKVISYSEARNTFGEDIVILCAFGSPRDEVLGFLAELDRRHTLYIPDVPLFCKNLEAELFTPEYMIDHRDAIEECAELWADRESKELYFEILAYRLSGEMHYLTRVQDFKSSVRECISGDIRRVIDGGAFTGDTAEVFLSVFPKVESLICAEPDPRSFRKLSSFAENDSRCHAVNAMLGKELGKREFMSSASRASAASKQNRRGKAETIPVITVDSLADGTGKLLVKLDVEGAEADALEGAQNSILDEKTALAVALYHRTQDIFEIPLMLRKMRGNLQFRIRRARCVPAWEITLFAE